MNGVWTVGTFTAYVSIFTALAVKASKASKLFNSFQKANVSWKRLKPYYESYVYDQEEKPHEQVESFCVKNLTFTYPGSNTVMIKDSSFQLKRGEILGVTGAVASGKSTLAIALTGVYPYSGTLFLNRHNLKEMNSAQKSTWISYQGHLPQLLSDTIYENITLGEQGDISEVLKDVCFDTDLNSMPDGINTMVGNSGIRLSGGQQARIALARALWHKAAVVILDDPFSALDSVTEQQIVKNLKAHYGDRIFIIMSHRLGAFPKFDRVGFLENGELITGTHENLMKQCSSYAELYHMQEVTP